MTVIVWTPTAMAADRLCSRGDTNYFVRKLWREGNSVVGLAGGSDYCTAMLDWFRFKYNEERFPRWQDKDDYAIMVVAKEGRCFVYDRTPFPVELLQPFAAFGCGREAALGALEMGADAKRAVEVACKWIGGCGGPIDVEKLQ